MAESASGYTIVELNFDVMENGESVPMTIVGQAICSGDDEYNGNLGVVVALRNAFSKMIFRKIDHPVMMLIDLLDNTLMLQMVKMTQESDKSK